MTSQTQQSVFGDLAAAFLLLSRFPVPYDFDEAQPPDFVSALWAFPLVSIAVGGLGSAALLLFSSLSLPAFLAASACLAVIIMTSGAMHEDGLADMADGFGGGHSVKDKLRIMHDSAVGSYGVLALCLSSLMQVTIFTAISNLEISAWHLLLIPAMMAAGARCQIALALHLYPLAKGAKLAHLVGRPTIVRTFVAFVLWISLAVGLVGLLQVIAATIAGITVVALFGWLAMRQIGGLNGDVMGGMIIAAEISIGVSLLAAPTLLGHFGIPL